MKRRVNDIDKRKIFLDYDGCIVNSVKRICELYNDDYANHPKFKPSKWYLVNEWDFRDQCPLINKDLVEEYFCQERFFIGLEFMENAYEIINKLSEHFDIYVVSLGFTYNLLHKNRWLKNNLPCIKRFIGCNFEDYTDKSHLNMSDGIIIDDSASNLETSSADLKICYGDIFDWNCKWNGIRKFNWYEIYDFLMN